MTYVVHIRNLESGEVRAFHEPFDWGGEADEFWWSDGIRGYEPNRHQDFQLAAGVPLSDLLPYDGSQYAVQITLPSGEVVYEDDEWEGD